MVFWAHLGPDAAMEPGSLPTAVDGGGFAVYRARTRGAGEGEMGLAEKKREGDCMLGPGEEGRGDGVLVIVDSQGTRNREIGRAHV